MRGAASPPAPDSESPLAFGSHPEPAPAVPWGVRVAAEVGWRLLVLAVTVGVLTRVISAVQLVVLAFAVALLPTAPFKPAVDRLKQTVAPRGPATALTAFPGPAVPPRSPRLSHSQVSELLALYHQQTKNLPVTAALGFGSRSRGPAS